jgi:hypothetical protein
MAQFLCDAGFNGDCPRKCKRISYHAILIFDAIS